MRTDTPFYLANTVHRRSFRPAEILPCGKTRGNDVLEGGRGLGVAFESRNGIAARARFPAVKPLKVAGTAVEKMYFPMAKCLIRSIRRRRTAKTSLPACFAVRQNLVRMGNNVKSSK